MLRAMPAAGLISRLRRTVSTIDLDPRSRDALVRAFDRFAALEQRRELRAALASAREQRDQIVRFLGLLAELDDLTDREQDRSAFVEVALLFRAIEKCATEGAAAIANIMPNASEKCQGKAQDQSNTPGVMQPECCGICHIGGGG